MPLPFGPQAPALAPSPMPPTLAIARQAASPSRPRFREPVNGFLHLGAFGLAALGTGAMLWASQGLGWALQAALGLYGLSMMACFLGSSLHHLVVGSERLELRLLRWDQALIFPFIAGSYTPVCVGLLPGQGGLWLLALVWAMAAAGVTYRLGFAPDPASVKEAIPPLDTALYVLMGWQVVWQLGPLMAHVRPGTLPLVVLGGLAYSLGGVILSGKFLDLWPGRFGHHEIWHLCVMAGAALVYAFLWVNLLL